MDGLVLREYVPNSRFLFVDVPIADEDTWNWEVLQATCELTPFSVWHLSNLRFRLRV